MPHKQARQHCGTPCVQHRVRRCFKVKHMRSIQATGKSVDAAIFSGLQQLGAFLLAGGAKGKRIALPNAEIMIHQPLIGGGGVRGPVTDIQIVTEQMQKTKQWLTRILSENTGKSFAEVAADTERDNYMSAQEALAYGLIDKIIDKR